MYSGEIYTCLLKYFASLSTAVYHKTRAVFIRLTLNRDPYKLIVGEEIII